MEPFPSRSEFYTEFEESNHSGNFYERERNEGGKKEKRKNWMREYKVAGLTRIRPTARGLHANRDYFDHGSEGEIFREMMRTVTGRGIPTGIAAIRIRRNEARTDKNFELLLQTVKLDR